MSSWRSNLVLRREVDRMQMRTYLVHLMQKNVGKAEEEASCGREPKLWSWFEHWNSLGWGRNHGLLRILPALMIFLSLSHSTEVECMLYVYVCLLLFTTALLLPLAMAMAKMATWQTYGPHGHMVTWPKMAGQIHHVTNLDLNAHIVTWLRRPANMATWPIWADGRTAIWSRVTWDGRPK